MSDYQLLSKNQHRDIKINTNDQNCGFFHTRIAPALISEVNRLVADYPLFISKNSQTGEFVLVALLGFDENENLFVQNGEWLSSSVPLAFSRQPFLIDHSDGSVLIDMQSESISLTDGEALFDEAGETTAFLQNKLSLLETIYNGAQPTQDFINLLQQYNLLESVQLDITFADQSQQNFDGLYTISAEKLASLDDHKVVQMHRQNCLEVCYLIHHSLQHMPSLIARKNAKLS